MARDTTRGGSLERWSPTAFLVAAAGLFVYTAANGVQAAGEFATPEWVFGLVVAPGMAVALVGLLGLVGPLSDRTPSLSRVAGAVAVVAFLAALATATSHMAHHYVSGVEIELTPLFYLVMVVGTILSFLLVGTASLRARTPSRTVGILLFGPAVVYAVMLSTGLAGVTPEWLTALISALQTVAHVAVGLALRSAGAPTDEVEPAVEPTGT